VSSRSAKHLGLALAVLGMCACGASKPKVLTGAAGRAQSMSADVKGTGGERCDASKPDREVSEYDTNGDGTPDVRKVFLSIKGGVETRLVLICRETDVNGDGKKDVIRYYDDEGRSLREEADRNFDGKMDQLLVYQNGQVAREELDGNYDGKIDTKIFYDGGKPQRAERDLSGHSTAAQWKPDRWEYYEDNQMVRMGTDLDGDGRVDRWDRDLGFKSKADQQAEADQAKAEAAAAASPAEAAPSTPAPATGKPAATASAQPAKPAAKAKGKSAATSSAKAGQ